jgi:hypothetical protein
MTKDEKSGLAALVAAVGLLAEAQAKQTAQMSEVISLLQPRPMDTLVPNTLPPDASTTSDDEKRTIVHNADRPVTLIWNGERLTIYPGPNVVPACYAAQYENYLKDVEFQKRNAQLLRDPVYLSRQLAHMCSDAGLEIENEPARPGASPQ